MQRLDGKEGFPHIHDSTMLEGYSLLVMDVLGANLRTLKDKYGGKLCLHTCL